METLTRDSPAKLNLALRVIRRRPDGYHEIESLVTRIGLADTVSVTPRRDSRWTIDCSDPAIPCDSSNLALRALRHLADYAGVGRGVHIQIQKRIPVGAGLGGGSSNAATTLMLLNELWQFGLPAAELAQVAARIGADVSLFFHDPLCIVRGVGETVVDVHRPLDAWVLIVLASICCETARVYAAWDSAAPQPERPSIDEILAKLESPTKLMPLLFNDLEAPAFDVYPELADAAHAARQSAGDLLRLTGSGSALYRLFDDPAEAHTCAVKIRETTELRALVVPTGSDTPTR